VRIPPSGPCSHDQCRCSQEKKNGSCIDDRNKGNEHVAGHQSCTRRQIIIPHPLTRPLSRRPAAQVMTRAPGPGGTARRRRIVVHSTWRAIGQAVSIYLAIGSCAVTAPDNRPGRATFAEMIAYARLAVGACERSAGRGWVLCTSAHEADQTTNHRKRNCCQRKGRQTTSRSSRTSQMVPALRR
jgi:hypothetical protein